MNAVERDEILRLPGSAEEKRKLKERLEGLNEQDETVLAAAMLRKPPQCAADMLGHLDSLPDYICCPAGSYAQLGAFFLLGEGDISADIENDPELEELGRRYEDEHPGVFIGCTYVQYPEKKEQTAEIRNDITGLDTNLFDRMEGMLITKRQYGWLERRLQEMTVKERLVFAAAMDIESPETVEQVIDIASQLDRCSLLYGAGDVRALGLYYMDYIEPTPEAARGYLKTEQLGQSCLDSVTGCFHSGHFIRMDSDIVYSQEQDLDALPTTGDYAIRIRLASRNNMDGVWVGFPDSGETTAGLYPDELRLGLKALQVENLGECIALEVDCCLPQLTDILSQYDSTEKLLNHAMNFGYVCAEQGQGMPHFMEKWQAVLELEDCHRLDQALDYSQNLHCYHFIPNGWEEKFGLEQAERDGILPKSDVLRQFFDGETYAGEYAMRHGLSVTDHGLAAWNGQQLSYEFSQPPQGPEMTM